MHLFDYDWASPELLLCELRPKKASALDPDEASSVALAEVVTGTLYAMPHCATSAQWHKFAHLCKYPSD
jgi:hypothetical protein